MTVISLADKKRESSQEVIYLLEEVLELAREGKIVDLIVGYTDNDRATWTRMSVENLVMAVGLAVLLKADVMSNVSMGDL